MHRETQLFVQVGTSALRVLDLKRLRPDFRREMLVHQRESVLCETQVVGMCGSSTVFLIVQ
jgi:hypothetical protein